MRFHQFRTLTEQELYELKMSPGALNRFATSEAAEGIQAGFEAELVFTGIGEASYDEIEPDYDADERCRSLEEIIEFFENDEWGYGLSGRDADRLRERLDEAYYEWLDEQQYSAWRDEREELIKEAWLEEKPWVERVHAALVDGLDLTDDEADAVQALYDRREKGEIKGSEMSEEELEMASQYSEARSIAEDILDEDVETSINDEDKLYDRVLDQFRDDFYVDGYSGFFSDAGLRWMSDVANNYDLMWPVMTGTGGGEGGWSDSAAYNLADSLSNALGVKTTVSGGYHTAKRDTTTWIFEPDSSLDADDSENMAVEIVSPPMPLEECLKKMEDFFAWAESEGAYANSSTGFHMGVSLPHRGGSVDYLKLALFLGDEQVLRDFGRQANTFCEAAMKKIRNRVKDNSRIGDAMDLMRGNLIELAHRSLDISNHGFGKYTSINPQGGRASADPSQRKDPKYIEFRSAGGPNYFKDIDKLKNTLLRYAQAMAVAGNPAAYRNEYAKKLYKLIAPASGDSALDLFARYQAGTINAAELKKAWADKALATEKPKGDEREWEAYDAETGEVLGTTKNSSITNATNYFRDELGLNRFQVREKEPEAISPRAKLAKRIKDTPPEEYQHWRITNTKTGEIEYDELGHKSVLMRVMRVREKENNWPPGTLKIELVKPDPQVAQDPDPTISGDWEFVRDETGQVIDRVNGINQMQADAVRRDIVRRYGHPDSSVVMRRVGQQTPAAQSTNPNPTVQNPDQVRMPNGVPVWELVDRTNGQVVHVVADHTQREADQQARSWLQSAGVDNASDYIIRPKMLQPGERNLSAPQQ